MSNPVQLDQDVKAKLGALLSQVDPVIEKVLAEMTSEELRHALDTMRNYLKLNLVHNFEKELQSRNKNIEDFDGMFNEITK